MKRIAIALTAPGTIGYLDEAGEDRALQSHEVRVQTLYSGISAGTELSYFRGSNPFQAKRWDAERRLFIPTGETEPSIPYPVRNWGYEECGVITECGNEVSDLAPGTRVFGTWGHRSGTILAADYVRERILPPEIEPVTGIFSHIGPIALNGILDGAIRLGETVAVFGLGVVGNVVGQLAKLSGATVIGVDLLQTRLDKAREVGFDTVLNGSDGSAAERIKELTGGRGADVCFEASGAIPALHEAIRACAYSSRVVVLGFYQGGAGGLYLGEEFHHNRIELICSQIGGVNPALQGRWNRIRLVQTFTRLLAEKRVQMRPLITHIGSAWDAQTLFNRVANEPANVLQAVLDFQDNPPDDLVIDD
jgi:threonine dehydrogenase-like Zn-dependent dehydrogenase